MKNSIFIVMSVAAMALAGCSDAPEDPAPKAPEEAPAGQVTPQRYHAGVSKPPPPPHKSYQCDDGGLCSCFGDPSCNDMFEDLPCNTGNSMCIEEQNKCYCDLEGDNDIWGLVYE